MAYTYQRTTKSGLKRYGAQIRLKGFDQVSRSDFETQKERDDWVMLTEADMLMGRWRPTTGHALHTFEEAVDRYIEFVVPTLADGGVYAHALKWFKSQIGARALTSITRQQIVELRDVLRRKRAESRHGDPISPSTVNRYVSYLSSLYRTAIEEWGWAEVNPVNGVRRLKEPRHHVRYLTDDERKRLLAQCKKSVNLDLYDAVFIALVTGLRRSELLGMQWSRVDLERGAVEVPQTKNGSGRTVWLDGEGLEILKRRAKVRQLDSDLVFVSRRYRTRPIHPIREWLKAVKDARVENFRWHDLRHTWASYMLSEGISLAQLKDLGGWRTLAAVQVYAHLEAVGREELSKRITRRTG